MPVRSSIVRQRPTGVIAGLSSSSDAPAATDAPLFEPFAPLFDLFEPFEPLFDLFEPFEPLFEPLAEPFEPLAESSVEPRLEPPAGPRDVLDHGSPSPAGCAAAGAAMTTVIATSIAGATISADQIDGVATAIRTAPRRPSISGAEPARAVRISIAVSGCSLAK